MTKTTKTNLSVLNKVKKFWEAIGAKVAILSPQEHDSIASEISHLPHLLAMSLCLSVDKKALKFASSGFKDTTRIAASEAELWSDIFLFNKEALLKSVNKLEQSLRKLKTLINSNNKKLLFKELEKAKLIRQKMGTPFKV
jgi:prephenate dehydrogenase